MKPEINMTADTWSKLKKGKVCLGNYKASKVFALIDSLMTDYEVQLVSEIQAQNKSLLRNFSVVKRQQLKEWLSNKDLEVEVSAKWYETAKKQPTRPFVEVEVHYLGETKSMRFSTKQNFPTDKDKLAIWTSKNIDKLL